MFRQPKDADLVGKTIKSIDTSAVNVLKVVFTDETVLELWAESAISTPAGSIPGIFVEEAE